MIECELIPYNKSGLYNNIKFRYFIENKFPNLMIIWEAYSYDIVNYLTNSNLVIGYYGSNNITKFIILDLLQFMYHVDLLNNVLNNNYYFFQSKILKRAFDSEHICKTFKTQDVLLQYLIDHIDYFNKHSNNLKYSTDSNVIEYLLKCFKTFKDII